MFRSMWFLFWAAGGIALAGEVFLQPAGKENYGSGISQQTDAYYPGGIPQMGVMLGQPNTLNRNDRALFRFDLTRFLLAPAQFKTAELRFGISAINGQPSQRKVRVEHFLHPLEKLSGAALTDPRIELVAVVDFSPSDLPPSALPKKIDVTAMIRKDIERGFTTTTFRFSDATVEDGKISTGPNEVAIATEGAKMPSLKITRAQ